MLRLQILCIFVTIVGCTADGGSRPNIIVIMADDLGFNDLSFRGPNEYNGQQTPNIDALAFSGIVLDRHYVLPICTPSRAAFLTGKHPLRFGLQGYPLKAGENRNIPMEEKLLPQYLKDLGYQTHMLGKWHVGYSSEEHLPHNRGFDTFLGYYNGYVDYYKLDHNQTLDNGKFYGYDFHDQNGTRRDLQGQYATNIITDEAVKIIKNHNETSPLFIYISHLAVHTGSEEGHGLQSPPGVNAETDSRFSHFKKTESRYYASLIQSLDESVGKVVASLSDRKILSNSIIVFMSDNGAMSVSSNPALKPNFGSNYPLRGQKFTFFEGGVRGAALIWSPLLPYMKVHKCLMHMTDWLPTLVHAAGGQLCNVDGVNQWENFKTDCSQSYKQQFLINIDEEAGAAGVILDERYKVVKQNLTAYAVYKHNFGEKVERTGEKRDVLESEVGKIMKVHVGNKLNETSMTIQSNDWKVKCDLVDVRQMGYINTTEEVFCPDFCVFDILSDPCEEKAIRDGTETKYIERVKQFLSDWESKLEKPNTNSVDQESDPKKFDGVWSPWLRNGCDRGPSMTWLNISVLISTILYSVGCFHI